jgi:hypothetical protein
MLGIFLLMNKYTPFLKFKTGEIGAIKALSPKDSKLITPFFDLATKQEITPQDIENTISKGVRKYELNLKKVNSFYIDDYDLDNDIEINGENVYQFLINKFSAIPFIPVVGLDRSDERIESVRLGKVSGNILSDTLALRLTKEDFQNFSLTEDDLEELYEILSENGTCLFSKIHLILDYRLCNDSDPIISAQILTQFIQSINNAYKFEKIIITGSSICPSVANIVKVGTNALVERFECKIQKLVMANTNDLDILEIGDYCTVSPNYSDVVIPTYALRKVMTPKIVYSKDDHHLFIRGHSIDSHARGALQYDDMCVALINSAWFRGKSYSEGDKYLFDKSNGVGKNAQPGTITKPLINAHITYMLNNY